MADISLSNGWHSTDDEVPVPVRASSTPISAPTPALQSTPLLTPAPSVQALPPSARSMRLSAVMGVLLVLGAVGTYLGLGSDFLTELAGDITAEEGEIIAITTAGTFDPETLTVSPGDTVTFVNENADPQVLKSTNDRELFPVQVLFEDPYTFTIPADAMGPYVYFSETLPDDRTITINVVESAASETGTDGGEIDIPLPVLENEPTPEPEDTEPETSPEVTVERTEHSDETATISITGRENESTPEPSPSPAPAPTSALPTNPYTVERGQAQESRMQALTEQARQTQRLHSGAPLQGKGYTPPRQAETGPAGTLAFVIPALFGLALVYRRTVRG